MKEISNNMELLDALEEGSKRWNEIKQLQLESSDSFIAVDLSEK